MTKTLTISQMREADRRCIEELGIPGAVLMNNAGAAVYAELPPGSVGIVCGKGNNGGDGYVVARHALLAGRETRVVLLADRAEIRGDAKIYLDIFERLGGSLQVATSKAEIASAMAGLSDCDVVIDAVLGTGVSGEIRGVARDAIENWPDVPTVAVDIPSGISGDSGLIGEVAVRATKTVTLQFRKPCFDDPEVAPYCGELIVADIGIPAVCAADATWGCPSTELA